MSSPGPEGPIGSPKFPEIYAATFAILGQFGIPYGEACMISNRIHAAIVNSGESAAFPTSARKRNKDQWRAPWPRRA